MNRRDVLTRLHNGEIKKVPVNFWCGVTKKEVGQLFKFVTSTLYGYNMDDVRNLSRNHVCDMGFTSILQNKEIININSTYELINLGYPDIKPWEVKTKPKELFSDINNLFELLNYHFKTSNFTYNDTRPIVHIYQVMKPTYSTLEELKEGYMKWLSDKKEHELKVRDNLNIYKELLCGNIKKFPTSFWTGLDKDSLVSIVKYGIENVLQISPENVDIPNNIKFSELKLSRLNKAIALKTGEIFIGHLDILKFVYNL